MKNLLILISAILIAATVNGQAPEQIKYQAIARNPNGTPITNQNISIRIRILHGQYLGVTQVTSEIFHKTTNDYGLFNLEIGSMDQQTFKNIDWGSGPYSVEVSIDPLDGTNFIVMGTSELLSVPYALYAKSAATTTGHYIGELFGGGIIFYLYKEAGVEHGLIASLTDVATNQIWSNVTAAIGTDASSRWDGLNNSNAIVAQAGHTTSAADVCLNYSVTDASGTYNDWYLPARLELIEMINQGFILDKILGVNSLTQSESYWTSTEYYSSDKAYCLWFPNHDVNSIVKNDPQNSGMVRAVRRF